MKHWENKQRYWMKKNKTIVSRSCYVHFLPYTHTYFHMRTRSISSVSSTSEHERLVIAHLPRGLMTPRKPNRSWWYDRRAGEGVLIASPPPLCSFTTLQNSLLICCSVWGVWIVPASITIITRAVGTPSLGPSHWTAPEADHSVFPHTG